MNDAESKQRATMTHEEVHVAAKRMIDVVQRYNALVRLPYLFTEIGIDLETLALDEVFRILASLDAELCLSEYPKDLKQKIRFAAPFATPSG
jgi:hypothetical protein